MKYYLFLLLLPLGLMTQAQFGYNHINIASGLNTQGNNVHTLSYEINKGNMNAWEIALDIHLSDFDSTFTQSFESVEFAENSNIPRNFFINDTTAIVPIVRKEEIFQAVGYYKPMIAKHKNFMVHMKYGVGIGRSGSNFLLSGGAGFELSYTLPKQILIYIAQNNHYFINIDKRFRHLAQLGVKFPL